MQESKESKDTFAGQAHRTAQARMTTQESAPTKAPTSTQDDDGAFISQEQVRTLESYIGLIRNDKDDTVELRVADADITLGFGSLEQTLRRVRASKGDRKQYFLNVFPDSSASTQPSKQLTLSDPIQSPEYLVADIPAQDGKPRITFIYRYDELLEAIVHKDADTTWLRQFRFEELFTRPVRGNYLHLESMNMPEIRKMKITRGNSGQGQLTVSRVTQDAYDRFGVETTIAPADPENDENPARFWLPEYKKTTDETLIRLSSMLHGGVLDSALVPKLSRNLCWALRDDRKTPLYFIKLMDSEARANMECDALRTLAGQGPFLQPIFDVMPVTEGNVTLWAITYRYQRNKRMDTYEKVRQIATIHCERKLEVLRGFGAWTGHSVARVLKDVQDEKAIRVIKSLAPEYEAACERLQKGARCPTHTDAKDDNFHGGRVVDLEAIRHGHPAIDYGMIGVQDGHIEADDSEAFSYEIKRLAKTNKKIIVCTPAELEDGAIVGAYKEIGGLHSRCKSFGWNALRRRQEQALTRYLAGVAVKKKILDKNPYLAS